MGLFAPARVSLQSPPLKDSLVLSKNTFAAIIPSRLAKIIHITWIPQALENSQGYKTETASKTISLDYLKTDARHSFFWGTNPHFPPQTDKYFNESSTIHFCEEKQKLKWNTVFSSNHSYFITFQLRWNLSSPPRWEDQEPFEYHV
jgi:hypothetical protein